MSFPTTFVLDTTGSLIMEHKVRGFRRSSMPFGVRSKRTLSNPLNATLPRALCAKSSTRCKTSPSCFQRALRGAARLLQGTSPCGALYHSTLLLDSTTRFCTLPSYSTWRRSSSWRRARPRPCSRSQVLLPSS